VLPNKAGNPVLDQEPDATAPPTAAVAETTAAEPEVGTDDTAAEDANAEEPVEDIDQMEQNIVVDDLDGMSFEDAIDATIVAFDDGDLVHGKVVKIDSDEVLLDIGYKSEGVIPSKELSIRNDVDPHEVVSLGEEIEALVLQKEDKDGRLILSKKRAQYERAWGTIEQKKENEEVVSCAASATSTRTSAACSSARSSSSTRTATTSCCRAGRTWKRRSASSATSSSPT
jgi:transcriptional accessory protein Tex/SPT6